MSIEGDIRYMVDAWGYSYAQARQALEDGAQADIAIERGESMADSLRED